MQLSSIRSLLLNASYEPMKIVSWQKALILWLQDKVEVLEYHKAKVRSVHQQFRLPSVLRLKNFVRNKKMNHIRFCRENIFIRDKHICQYCGEKFPYSKLTLDHVVPASKMGEKSWTNMVTACRDCNQKKANRTPKNANMPLLNEPKAPTWLPVIDFVETKSDKIPQQWFPYLSLQIAKTG